MTEPHEDGMPDGLTGPERAVWRAFRIGRTCDLTEGIAERDLALIHI
nr:hypothetical protein [Streptomyces venezuelae]